MFSMKKLACSFVPFWFLAMGSSEAFSSLSTTRTSQTCLFGTSTDEAKEIVWRHVKKPLLRLGAKGASASHGNSLKQLLEDHTAVKVKVNTKPYDGSLENAFTSLRDFAVENGAPGTLELIRMSDSDKILLIGLPGTISQVKEGSFPPPTPASTLVDGMEEY